MRRVIIYRLLVVASAIALLEVLCLAGVIDKITMQPPHLIARDLYRMLVSGRMNAAPPCCARGSRDWTRSQMSAN